MTNPPTTPDIAIQNAIVLTVNDDDEVYERGTVLIDEGELLAVRPSKSSDQSIDAELVINGDGKLVMPGLVNT
ncbi:MAG: N-ethylammeline chlorohydrolase, partial [Salinirussus sp.]